MSHFTNVKVLPGLMLIVWTRPALAGMPIPYLVVSELGQRRLEELSFFLVGFLVMAAIVRWLWNYLRRDFPMMPVLSYGRSVSLLILSGLFMTVILALVSGARELMTPGAWVPSGVTYKLASGQSSKTASSGAALAVDQQRRLKLENLRFALWQFVQSHDGRFPTAEEAEEIGSSLWLVNDQSPLRFIYVPDQRLRQPSGILIYEPEVYDDGQYVILTDGAIAKLSDVTSHRTSPPSQPVAATVTPISVLPPADAERASNVNGGQSK